MTEAQLRTQFSSQTDMWETPQDFFDKLNAEFHFTMDACAVEQNAKCKRFISPQEDGLKASWDGVVWCNPPYGKTIGKWVQKAHASAQGGAVVVMLIPARTDTRWFHDYIYRQKGVEIRFIKGRLRFGNSTNSAPFPSMVVIFNNQHQLPHNGEKG